MLDLFDKPLLVPFITFSIDPDKYLVIGSLYIIIIKNSLLLLQISKNPQRVSDGIKWKLKGG